MKSINPVKLLMVSTIVALTSVGQTYAQNREVKTLNGKTIVVTETHPNGASSSNLSVSFKGNKKSTFTVQDVDPVSSIFVDDLDGNGFSEVYILTTAAGSGSSVTPVILVSNKDKSFSRAYFPEVAEADMAKGKYFEGYMGHDEYQAVETTLVRRFPVYKAGDANAKPTGGKRDVSYKMKAGEAGWKFVPVSMNNF